MSNSMITSILKELKSALKYCPEGSNMCSSFAALVNPLYYAHVYARIDESSWKESLIPLLLFAKEVNQFLSTQRVPLGQTLEKMEYFHNKALHLHSSLDEKGFFNGFNPSLRKAILIAKLAKVLDIRLHSGTFTSPTLGEADIKRFLENLHIVMQSTECLYDCLESILTSPFHTLCPISAVHKSASLYNQNIKSSTSLSARKVSISTGANRFLVIFKAMTSFFQKLETLSSQESHIIKVKTFLSTLLDSPFLPPVNLEPALNDIKAKVRLEPALRQPIIHNSHFIMTDAERRLWSTRVTYKAYSLKETDAAFYPQFCDAVLRLHALSHPSIVALHGAQWPLSPFSDNSPRLSEHVYAIVVTEQMTTSLVSAIPTLALASQQTRMLILHDVLSAIASLHNAGIRHGAINTHTIFLNMHAGTVYGHAKLDLPPLVDTIFSPAQLSTMSVEELMFQAPDEQHPNGSEYLAGDVWSFGLIACLLLSDGKSISKLKESYADIFLREGRIAMARKWLTEISYPAISDLISQCLREDLTERVSISELMSALSPLLKETPTSSQFVKRELGIATIKHDESSYNNANNKILCSVAQKVAKQGKSCNLECPLKETGCDSPRTSPGNCGTSACFDVEASNVRSSQNQGENISSSGFKCDPHEETAVCVSPDQNVPGALVTAVNSDVTKPLDRSDCENSFEHALMDIAAYGAKQAAKEVENARQKMRKKRNKEKSSFYEDESDFSSPQCTTKREPTFHEPFLDHELKRVSPSLERQYVDIKSSKKTKITTADTDNGLGSVLKAEFDDTKNSFSKLLCADLAKDDRSARRITNEDEMELGETEKESVWKSRVRAQARGGRKNYADPGSSDDFSDESDNGNNSSQMADILQSSSKSDEDSIAVSMPRQQSISNSTIKSSSAFSEDKLSAANALVPDESQQTIKQESTKRRKLYKRRRSSFDAPPPHFIGENEKKVRKKESFDLEWSKPFVSDFLINEPSSGPGHQNLMLGIRFEEGRGVPANILTAVLHYQAAVAQGNVKAKIRLARCSEKGTGTAMDPKKASSLFCSAADEGEHDALYDAGRCCELGIGMDVDYERALLYYERAAGNGSADAMLSAGKLIRNGKGTEKDNARAFQYFNKAANSNTQGKVELASCYAKGQGVKRCILKAIGLYREAADEGDPSAMLALGLLHEDGNGLRKSCDKALKLYYKSAQLGHGPGETALGQCHLWGYGVPLDYVKAKEFFLSAAQKGHALGFHELGMLYREGNGVQKDMQIAANHFRTAAVMGCEVGMVQLGECLYNGSGLQQNFQAAFEWFQKASDAGAADGSRWLGDCYADGSGTEKNPKKAVEFYKKASELGCAPALTSLASCHENGIGVPVNVSKAVSMYRRAADSGDHTAENNLGIIYESGKYVKRDYIKAVSYYRKAIQLGSVEAMCNLADCYAAGNGVQKCLETAIKWYKEGAKQGLASAQCELGICYYEGKGVAADPRHAVKLFREASDSEAEALRQLGRAYSEGNGVERDIKRAFEYLRSAATKGENFDACFDVGKCYDLGVGVAHNPKEAKKFYTLAAKSGNKMACSALGNIYYRDGMFREATDWYKLCHTEDTSITSGRAVSNPEENRQTRKS